MCWQTIIFLFNIIYQKKRQLHFALVVNYQLSSIELGQTKKEIIIREAYSNLLKLQDHPFLFKQLKGGLIWHRLIKRSDLLGDSTVIAHSYFNTSTCANFIKYPAELFSVFMP